MSIVAAEGLDALTMQRLADECDQAVGTLYRYFEGKEALVAALQREALEVLLSHYRASRAELEARLDGHDDLTAAARVIHLTRFVCTSAEALPEQFRLLQTLVADPRPIIPSDQIAVVVPSGAEVRELAEGLLADLPGETGTEDAVMWLAALFGVLGTRKLSRLEPSLFDADRLAEKLTESLLVAWGVSRAELQQASDLVGGGVGPDLARVS